LLVNCGFYTNGLVSDTAVFVLKRDVKLQLTNYANGLTPVLLAVGPEPAY